MGEAGLLLPVADLVLPAPTTGALPAGADERRGHPFAGVPQPHLGTDLDDLPGELMARDVRQRDVRVVPDPAVPIAAAQAGRGDPDDSTVGRADGIGNLPYLRQFAEPLEHHRAHRCIVNSRRSAR
jgi:hypothetical protein